MSIGQETGRRPGGRLRMDAAQFTMAAALGIMFLALLLAAAAVQAATLPAQRPDAPPTSGAAGPALILRDGDGALTALAPEAAELTARVDALAARVAVEHRFRAGPGPSRSGVYILPLPEDAEPRRVRVAVGDRTVEIGLAVERDEPRPELLALPISGIGPHAVVSIELIYDRAVALGGGRFVLALPLPQAASDTPQVSQTRWSSAGTGLRLELDPGLPIAELRSPSHGIDIQRGPGERRSILLADPEPAAGRDFILVWRPADPTASVAALRRFTAAERNVEPRPEEALLLRARPIGNSAALAPAVAQSALLAGSPIDDGAILTAIAARSGTGLAGSPSDISPALAGSILAIWALGALYFATRPGARSLSSFNPSTGPLQ